MTRRPKLAWLGTISQWVCVVIFAACVALLCLTQ